MLGIDPMTVLRSTAAEFDVFEALAEATARIHKKNKTFPAPPLPLI